MQISHYYFHGGKLQIFPPESSLPVARRRIVERASRVIPAVSVYWIKGRSYDRPGELLRACDPDSPRRTHARRGPVNTITSLHISYLNRIDPQRSLDDTHSSQKNMQFHKGAPTQFKNIEHFLQLQPHLVYMLHLSYTVVSLFIITTACNGILCRQLLLVYG